MAKSKLNDRQREVRDAVKAEVPVAQIAKDLGTSPGAIYQTISRLRTGGHLPKKGKAKARQPRIVRAPDFDEMVPEPAATNGHISLDEHVEQELVDAIGRMEEIDGELSSLGDEKGELEVRTAKLKAAKEALTA